jgi:hypothetical protein
VAPEGRDSGLGLAEMLVAWALFLVVMLASLSMLSTLRVCHARAVSALDAAERARTALGTIASDIRPAGCGVDPDGASDRTDEALEGAWPGAIVVRADFDGDESGTRDDPERWIAGVFPSASTGNDEIVAYALRRENGTGGVDLSFESDVFSSTLVTTDGGTLVAARDGQVETVRLTRVLASEGGAAGTGATLYRASVANNAALWGTGSAVVWQPVADGISTLSFRYFDEGGEEIAAPGGAESSRLLRGRIAAVEVRIVALESRPEAGWTDPADSDPATIHYRKAECARRIALLDRGRAVRRDGSGIAHFAGS